MAAFRNIFRGKATTNRGIRIFAAALVSMSAVTAYDPKPNGRPTVVWIAPM
jgi:hypothetical protein